MEETIPLGAASSLVSSTVCLFLQSAKDRSLHVCFSREVESEVIEC